jgi:hypothetical protein
MKGTSRQIKIPLAPLALGVWGLLARSFFPSATGSASAPPAVKRVYVASSDGAGKIFFDNSPGNIDFGASGLLSVLKEAEKKGITVHSVISISLGGYVVFVQK